jgi:hypothetical protein
MKVRRNEIVLARTALALGVFAAVVAGCVVARECWGTTTGDRIRITLVAPYDDSYGARGQSYGESCGDLDGLGPGQQYIAKVVGETDPGAGASCYLFNISIADLGIALEKKKYPGGYGFSAAFETTSNARYVKTPGCSGQWVFAIKPLAEDIFGKVTKSDPPALVMRVFNPDDTTACPSVPAQECVDVWVAQLEKL